MRNSRYGSTEINSERDAAPGIGDSNSSRKGVKHGSFVSY